MRERNEVVDWRAYARAAAGARRLGQTICANAAPAQATPTNRGKQATKFGIAQWLSFCSSFNQESVSLPVSGFEEWRLIRPMVR